MLKTRKYHLCYKFCIDTVFPPNCRPSPGRISAARIAYLPYKNRLEPFKIFTRVKNHVRYLCYMRKNREKASLARVER